MAIGNNESGICDIKHWRDIVAISANVFNTIGLKADGTVIGAGEIGTDIIPLWQDIVAISSGFSHTVGLKANGTVVAGSINEDGQCNTQDWRNIGPVSEEQRLKKQQEDKEEQRNLVEQQRLAEQQRIQLKEQMKLKEKESKRKWRIGIFLHLFIVAIYHYLLWGTNIIHDMLFFPTVIILFGILAFIFGIINFTLRRGRNNSWAFGLLLIMAVITSVTMCVWSGFDFFYSIVMTVSYSVRLLLYMIPGSILLLGIAPITWIEKKVKLALLGLFLQTGLMLGFLSILWGTKLIYNIESVVITLLLPGVLSLAAGIISVIFRRGADGNWAFWFIVITVIVSSITVCIWQNEGFGAFLIMSIILLIPTIPGLIIVSKAEGY
jgi:hypothetical protein